MASRDALIVECLILIVANMKAYDVKEYRRIQEILELLKEVE